MRGVIILFTALGTTLLGGCFLRLNGERPLRARGWEKKAEVANVTPKVVQAFGSPLTSLPQTENRTSAHKDGIHQVELDPKCKAIQDNILSSSNKKKRYTEDYYLHVVKKLQNCTWVRRPEESAKFSLPSAGATSTSSRPMRTEHDTFCLKSHIRLSDF